MQDLYFLSVIAGEKQLCYNGVLEAEVEFLTRGTQTNKRLSHERLKILSATAFFWL